MKRSKALPAALLALLLAGLAACGTLAEQDAGPEAAEGDRLVGAYVTWEKPDLLDVGAYVADHGAASGVMAGDLSSYQGRLYAEETSLAGGGTDYVFRDIEGVAVFFYSCGYGEGEERRTVVGMQNTGASDVYCLARNSEGVGYAGGSALDGPARYHGQGLSDSGSAACGLELSATIYASPPDGHIEMYVNPVYQDALGSIYLTAGQSLSGAMRGGERLTRTITSTRSVRGEDGSQTEETSYVEIRLEAIDPPLSARLLFMDADSAVISQLELELGAMPEEISPPAGTAYIVAETRRASGELTRSFSERGDDSLELLVTLPGELWQLRGIPIDWD